MPVGNTRGLRSTGREPPAEELADIRSSARSLENVVDLDALVERVGDASLVLLGEASHGTSEYYRWRAHLTGRLIEEKGFSFVAVEGDWPDCYRINRWVKGKVAEEGTARRVLRGFERWPTWMWANEEVAVFIDWLRHHNDGFGERRRVGFYGLDVYSLWDSMREIVGYLVDHEPDAVEDARSAYRCFEPYGEDPQRYAHATRIVPISCEEDVVRLLSLVREQAPEPGDDPEDRFSAEQNAEVAVGAERYYRAMVRGGAESWNVRDVHMADTLDRLLDFHGARSKAVVWAHNTHIGDARATDMAEEGMVNLGQLARERRGDGDVVLVGFGGHRGSVIASEFWGGPVERMPVPAAREGSHEDLLQQALTTDALLVFPPDRASSWLSAQRGHRAIGVVYHPDREAWGNYVRTRMGHRYDAFLFFEDTSAIRPLHVRHERDEELETYPTGR